MALLFDEERNRLIEMISSEDKDNMYLVGLTILQLRDQRIETYGKYTADNEAYKDIVYLTDVISPETFLVKI